MGITQHTTGVDNVRSLANLAMLTGKVGRPGTGVNPLRGQNNVQGACDMGALPNVYPGYQPVHDPGVRARSRTAWNVRLPPSPADRHAR
jgi:predicted molibdopterin-dependent oxidoreductase YjgC